MKKSANSQISSVASEVISLWKEANEKTSKHKQNNENPEAATAEKRAHEDPVSSEPEKKPKLDLASSETKTEGTTVASDPMFIIQFPLDEDVVVKNEDKEKWIGMIMSRIARCRGPQECSKRDLSEALVNCLLNYFKGDMQKFKNQLLKVCTHLGDGTDPTWRQKLVRNPGIVKKLPEMTDFDFLSETKQKEMKASIDAQDKLYMPHERKLDGGLLCRKCHHNAVTFTQKQTRSADEPMTCFYECGFCGNKWRE